MIKAVSILKTNYPDYQLIIVGEGKERDSLEKLVKQLDLQENVTFLGSQPQKKVSELMRESRLFILPSIEEGQGVVLVEALASGTPCIGSHVGGIPDVITPEVGQLVEVGNVQDLANSIESFLLDDAKWLKASANARTRAETQYDWLTLAEKIIDVYHSVISGRD